MLRFVGIGDEKMHLYIVRVLMVGKGGNYLAFILRGGKWGNGRRIKGSVQIASMHLSDGSPNIWVFAR